MNKFEIRKDRFYVKGEEFKLISGAIHYFRTVPEYWQDRLEKLKLMGCNAVETIVPWNIHEPEEGTFNFEGRNNLFKFMEIANDLGLYVILRPSPYICGEWEFGGTPYWLLTKQDIRLRSSDGDYLKYVEKYYKQIIPQIAKWQITNGKNVILVQIENEYGDYADDQEYLLELKRLLIENGIDVPFFTSDGPRDKAIKLGNLNDYGVLPTLNFGSDADNNLNTLQRHFQNIPLVCMEYWIGWFDAYGEKHHMRSAIDCAIDFEKIIKRGHVNIYMFHGGTNFGYMNGANDWNVYKPLATSYDYDALLTEDGQITEKYLKFQEVIGKYKTLPQFELSTQIKKRSFETIKVDKVFDAFKNLEHIASCKNFKYPRSFEKLGQPYGYVYYRTTINTQSDVNCRLYKAADRAIYYQDDSIKLSTLFDREIEKGISYSMNKNNEPLGVLIENVGRVNYYANIDHQAKGINHSLHVNGHIKTNFDHFLFDFHDLNNLNQLYTNGDAPTISKFILNIDEPADTFVNTINFGKGVLIVNDEVVGRFWDVGPQERLYIPAPFLKAGNNQIYIFETEGKRCDYLDFYTEQKWSQIEVHQSKHS